MMTIESKRRAALIEIPEIPLLVLDIANSIWRPWMSTNKKCAILFIDNSLWMTTKYMF